ncbi:MAG: class IV adenylate cyclase [Archaeoglobaceae archaeon]|nr:class IV adenylate cyclase [Archaeoglobaceae archaeon]MDW8118178.1 class IV adenylate cyclase [Archaeoglobaceae archaeon]
MEVEAKFKLKQGVEEKIKKIAKFFEEKEEFDVYLNHPCRDFAKTDEALRLRVDKKVKLTYKGPKIDSETKSREEVNVEVNNFHEALKLLEFLGFRKFRAVKKLRKIYRMDKAIICVDSVEGLGDFIEIEVEGGLENKEEIFRIAEMLGYTKAESIRLSYLEMLEKIRSGNKEP